MPTQILGHSPAPTRNPCRRPRRLNGYGAEVDAGPHARADDLAQDVGEPGEVPDGAGLGALDAERHAVAPKKCCSVVTIAAVAQRWPDGLSGNAGVTSGGAPGATGVDGSNSGSQSLSALVARLPSVSASRMAVIGRQKFQRYFSCQQPIAESAPARFVIASIRALSASDRWLSAARVRNTRLYSE